MHQIEKHLITEIGTLGFRQCQRVLPGFSPRQQLAEQPFDLSGRQAEFRIAKHPKQFQGGGLGQHRQVPASLPAMADPGKATLLKEQPQT